MKKQHTSFSPALRFRRWSRKAYAVFVSIQHAVTIGALQAHLVERLKDKNELPILGMVQNNDAEELLAADVAVVVAFEELVKALFLSACAPLKAVSPAAYLDLYYYNTDPKGMSFAVLQRSSSLLSFLILSYDK